MTAEKEKSRRGGDGAGIVRSGDDELPVKLRLEQLLQLSRTWNS